jgi:hypothetical protein
MKFLIVKFHFVAVETQSSFLNLGLGVGFLPGIIYDKCGPYNIM